MYYKVKFGGFAYVEADTEEEAEEKFFDNMEFFKETGIAAIEEVDEATITI